MFRQGFSLIEVLVVMGILGILAAIALPTYNQYSARAKGVQALPLFFRIGEQLREKYEKTGTMTGSVTIGAKTVNIGGGWTVINAASNDNTYPPIHGVIIYPAVNISSANGGGVMIGYDATLDGLTGLTGYTASTVGQAYVGGVGNTIRAIMYIRNGHTVQKCGLYPNSFDLNSTYLQSLGCTCTNINAAYTAANPGALAGC